jgi:hypothetical protein
VTNRKLFIFNMFHTYTSLTSLAVLGIIAQDSEKNKRFQLSTPVDKAVDNFGLALEADQPQMAQERLRHINKLAD